MENEFYNEHVKKALENISKGKTNESLGQLAASLYATSLLIPVIWDKAPKVNKEEQYVFEPNTRFQFPLVRNEQKNSFLILFTSMEEYKKWDPQGRFNPLVLPFRQFMNLIDATLKNLSGVLLDPLSHEVVVGMDFLKGIKVGQSVKLEQKTFEEGEVLTLKEPENADEFISIIKETSKEVEEIKSIYLKERDGYWFIIVDAENESVELFQKLGRMWTPYAMGKQMQFLFASVPACEDILKFSRPVYRK